jgi:uncharacterized membrane protein (DUF485 family)
MFHENHPTQQTDNAIGYKTRLGVIMFIIYGLAYAGFVIINVTNPALMKSLVFLGLNLAVIYGFGLIVFALVLAVIYNHLCTKKEKEVNKQSPKTEQDEEQTSVGETK